MSSQVSRLPSRFPVGTRYVVEGRNGRVDLRYLEFPDGRHVDLPADVADPASARVARTARRARRSSVRKF
jgi:hypothetical protein